MQMKPLFHDFIKDHISIAVGVDTQGWYVQTTDKAIDTYYSEPIEEGLETKVEAMAIANHYARCYGLDVVVWDAPDIPTTIHADHPDKTTERLVKQMLPK